MIIMSLSVFRVEVINFVPDLVRGGGGLHYPTVWITLIIMWRLPSLVKWSNFIRWRKVHQIYAELYWTVYREQLVCERSDS